MLLMSPGLALFLYGVSSIPSEGTVLAAGVLLPGLVGLGLITAFVLWAFRPEHPLLDLRLFQDRNLTLATVVMFLFAGSFFGALLLVPTYFQQVRGETVLDAGLLVAPQGLGAMVTLPIAGALVDRYPVGRIVPFGLLGILLGMVGLALTSGVDTPYWQLLIALFVLGLGMGGTMMPIFTSALKTLRAHQVARGSTLINVIQQVASSVGVALISVVLTSRQDASEALRASLTLSEAGRLGVEPPAWAVEISQRMGDSFVPTVFADLAGSFQTSYWVATAVLLVTFIPVAFLPRRQEKSQLLDGEGGTPAEPVILH